MIFLDFLKKYPDRALTIFFNIVNIPYVRDYIPAHFSSFHSKPLNRPNPPVEFLSIPETPLLNRRLKRQWPFRPPATAVKVNSLRVVAMVTSSPLV